MNVNHIEINKSIEDKISQISKYKDINEFFKSQFSFLHKNIFSIFIAFYITCLWMIVIIDISPSVIIYSYNKHNKVINKYISNIYMQDKIVIN